MFKCSKIQLMILHLPESYPKSEKNLRLFLNISNDDIINFTKTNPGLRGRFKYSEDGKKKN